MHRLLGRQADLLHRVRGLRLLFFAGLASGIGTWLAFVALTVDVWDRTHSGNWVARAADRRLPAGDRPRPDRRSADRPLLAAASHGGRGHRPLRRLLRAPVRDQPGSDRRLRGNCGLRHRLLQAGCLRRVAEPRRGRGAAERAGPAPGRGRDDDDLRAPRRRSARRRRRARTGPTHSTPSRSSSRRRSSSGSPAVYSRSPRLRPRATGATSRRA